MLEFGVGCRGDVADLMPDLGQGLDVVLERLVQAAQVVFGGVERGERRQKGPRLGIFVQLVGQRARGGIVLGVLTLRPLLVTEVQEEMDSVKSQMIPFRVRSSDSGIDGHLRCAFITLLRFP